MGGTAPILMDSSHGELEVPCIRAVDDGTIDKYFVRGCNGFHIRSSTSVL